MARYNCLDGLQIVVPDLAVCVCISMFVNAPDKFLVKAKFLKKERKVNGLPSTSPAS